MSSPVNPAWQQYIKQAAMAANGAAGAMSPGTQGMPVGQQPQPAQPNYQQLGKGIGQLARGIYDRATAPNPSAMPLPANATANAAPAKLPATIPMASPSSAAAPMPAGMPNPIGTMPNLSDGSDEALAGGAEAAMASGGGVSSGVKPIAAIHISELHPLKTGIQFKNPIHELSTGGSMEGAMQAENRGTIDPGTAEFETHAGGGEIGALHQTAMHLHGIHKMVPKSAQKHIAAAHEETLKEIHQRGFSPAKPTDPTPAAGPATGASVAPEDDPADAPQEQTSGAPDFKAGGSVKHSKGGKCMACGGGVCKMAGGEVDEPKAAKPKKEARSEPKAEKKEDEPRKQQPKQNYRTGGMIDAGTSEFSSGSGKEHQARGMGVAKRGGDFSYKRGGRVR